MSPAGTQHVGLIGVADAQVGDGEREDGAALLGPVETWPAGELDDLAAGRIFAMPGQEPMPRRMPEPLCSRRVVSAVIVLPFRCRVW